MHWLEEKHWQWGRYKKLENCMGTSGGASPGRVASDAWAGACRQLHSKNTTTFYPAFMCHQWHPWGNWQSGPCNCSAGGSKRASGGHHQLRYKLSSHRCLNSPQHPDPLQDGLCLVLSVTLPWNMPLGSGAWEAWVHFSPRETGENPQITFAFSMCMVAMSPTPLSRILNFPNPLFCS